MKKILLSGLTFVLSSIVLFVVLKSGGQTESNGKRISFQKCEEYKKLTKSKGRVSGLHLLSSEEEEESEEGFYNCTRLNPFISGGQNVKKDEYLHMAAIGWINGTSGNIEFRCGGSLISERFILTAAHCGVSKKYGPPHFVRIGVRNLSSSDSLNNEADYLVEKFIVHEQYKTSSGRHDIALIELQRAVTFGHHHNLPACLYQNEFKEEYFVATGWGRDNTSTKSSDVLKKVLLSRYDGKKCQRTFGFDGFSEKSEICAGFVRENFDDTCKGDSGGPIQLQDKNACVYHLIGVTAVGSRDCGTRKPSIYTKVSNHIDWIESHVWPLN